MATQNPLFIPIEARALAVNQKVFQFQNFQRWVWNYSNVSGFLSPEPAPFSNTTLGFPSTGLQLHWTLPAPLRNAVQDAATGAVTYPYVPNRWLVVRYSGTAGARQATGWVVQSDYISSQDGSAPFLDPNASSPRVTKIGRAVPLSTWQEPDPEPSLFLTAVAPGNPMFATFQAFCPNVFSFFDPLTGVSETDTLSYLIAGWYSLPGEDFLAQWQTAQPPDFEAFLTENGWKVSQGQTDTATWAVYHTMVSGIQWSLNGAAPVSDIPDGGTLPLAVGNTAVDALTALIRYQAQQQNDGTLEPDLLEALQHGLLPQYDQPDPRFELALQIEQSWFGSRSGGFGWEIVNTPLAPGDTPPPPLSEEELQKEAAWLASLNQAQLDYEEALGTLASMQWYLYSLWWKNGFAENNLLNYPSTATQAQFEAAFDDTNSSSTISQVNTQLQSVATLRAAIPTGNTQEELATAVAAYAAAQQLPAQRQLKQLARRPYFQASDPVVLIPGLKINEELAPTDPVLCRFPSQLVTGVTFQGQPLTVTSMNGQIPTPAGLDSGQVPSELGALLNEFFFLDPDNATQLALVALGTSDPGTIQALYDVMAAHASDLGTPPDTDLATWAQPWSPLVLMWQVTWFPLPYQSGGTNIWTFDGEDYDWNGVTSAVGSSITYSGTIFLTAQASFNFRAQLQNFINDNPGSAAAEALMRFIDETDGWDFLSQSLVGLSQQMQLRDPLPYQSVDADPTTYFGGTQTISSLVGTTAQYAPVPGVTTASASTPTGFQPWRAGQFAFNRLTVIDRFGQSVEVVTTQTADNAAPILAEPLKPAHPVSTMSPQRFVQLNPRLLQPGRLEIDFVSCEDDSVVLGLEPDVNPVCAWLLHNYLDQSIAVYDNTGQALGEAWVVTNTADQQVVFWQPAPDSPYPTVQSLIDAPPVHHVGLFLQALQAQGSAAFDALLATVDARSWTIDSGDPNQDQALAMLAGRPVAMVRTRLMLALSSEPVTDPSWPFTFKPAAPAFTSYEFAIRLGEGAMRQDGLMGYFAGDDYGTFFAPDVSAELPLQDYIQPIGTGSGLTLPFDSATAAYLTVLMDPRAAVHATTGILPVESFLIPQPFVDAAFANMQVTFSLGPVLSDVQVPEGGGASTLLIPQPVEKNGTWDWLTYDGTAWSSLDVAPADAQARFNNVPPVLRTGLLRLSGALSRRQRS